MSFNYKQKDNKFDNEIEEEIDDNLGVLEAQIDKIHESYLKTFQEYLKRVYKEDSELYCNITEEYVTELANLFDLCFVGSLPLPGNLTAALANYTTLLNSERANLTAEFHTKITNAVEKAKDYYRCNYKCYFNTGSYGFTKHQYKRTW